MTKSIPIYADALQQALHRSGQFSAKFCSVLPVNRFGSEGMVLADLTSVHNFQIETTSLDTGPCVSYWSDRITANSTDSEVALALTIKNRLDVPE